MTRRDWAISNGHTRSTVLFCQNSPLAVIAPCGAARDHDSDSDAGGGRLGPALSSDSDSGLGLTASGKADWQDDDQEDDCPEPGEKYLMKYYK